MSNSEQSHHPDQSFLPEIRRARFERLTIYEVSEAELDILERGSPDSIYLNFAIFLLSVAISLTAALLTATIASNAIFVIFVVCTVVGYTGGLLLLVVWRKNRSSVSDCMETIRKRLPPEGIAEPFSKIESSKDTRA
jgi:hypothetical protein